MSDIRKASDILLTLEATLEKVLGYVHNMDMNIKTISNRLNMLEKTSVTPKWSPPSMTREAVGETAPSPELLAAAAKSQMPGLKPGVQLGPQRTMIATPKGQQISTTEEDEEYTFVDEQQQLEVDTKPIGQRRGVRTEEPDPNSERKMPVQQRIIYKDGKNVCLANVEIFQTGNKGEFNLIKKLRTNSAGKWAVALAPGKYLVSISKAGTSSKPNVEVSYSIDIPVSNVPLELAAFTLGNQQSR